MKLMRSPDAPLTRTPVAGRRVLVMGLGSFGGGLGTARWLVQEGAEVTVTDLASAEKLGASLAQLADLEVDLVLGEHREGDFLRSDLIVANPAVPASSPFLDLARRNGIQVTSEVALFLERVAGDVLAITGTQGKSSTVSMTHQLLRGAGLNAHLGGNIGGSLLGQLDSIEPGDPVVLELSSYQLEALPRHDQLAPVCAVALTNVLADHLERHGDTEAYAAAKARILELVGSSTKILAAEESAAFRSHLRLAQLEQRALFVEAPLAPHGREGDQGAALRIRDGHFRMSDMDLGAVADLKVPGTFQVSNALLALGLAHNYGVDAGKLRELLPTLTGLPHRMEDLGQRGGLRVIDNGVSTTPDSTQAVLRDVDRAASLLIGGQAKNLPLDGLLASAEEWGLRIFAFGHSGELLQRAFAARGLTSTRHRTLDDAVVAAFRETAPGGTLLFSPACASFDAYTNFRARAESFRPCFRILRRTESVSALNLQDPSVAQDVARLGEGARGVLESAALHAQRLHAEELSTEHLLSCMFFDESLGATRFVLFAFADPETLAHEILALSPGIMVIGSNRSLPFSVRGVRVLHSARQRASAAGAAAVTPADLLSCAVDELDAEVLDLLATVGLSSADLGSGGPTAPIPATDTEAVPAEGPLLKYFDADSRQSLGAASRIARQWTRESISPAHLVLAALQTSEQLADSLGVRASRLRMALGGRDEDLTPVEPHPLEPDAKLRQLLAAQEEGAGTLALLGHVLAHGSEEIRLLLTHQRVTWELYERSKGSFAD